MCVYIFVFFFLFKQKTAYEMRISDWSSDVCSSDLGILSIAAGILPRRFSPSFVHRGELRSCLSRGRRDRPFPLQRGAFDGPYDETGSRSQALWQDANRMAIGVESWSSDRSAPRQRP